MTDEALMILIAGLSTIGQGYRIEKAISETVEDRHRAHERSLPSSRGEPYCC